MSYKQQREVIFTMDDANYRVVCRFGHDGWINLAWWFHVEKSYNIRKWFGLFGPVVEKWFEIDRCWVCTEYESIEDLKSRAIKYYDKCVLLEQRIIDKAMRIN